MFLKITYNHPINTDDVFRLIVYRFSTSPAVLWLLITYQISCICTHTYLCSHTHYLTVGHRASWSSQGSDMFQASLVPARGSKFISHRRRRPVPCFGLLAVGSTYAYLFVCYWFSKVFFFLTTVKAQIRFVIFHTTEIFLECFLIDLVNKTTV